MVTIREIETRRDIKKFVRFVDWLYKDSPYFVPDMLNSQINDFIKDKNPAHEYCESKCFLAYRDRKIVGRIAAIYNTHANEKVGKNQMRFSHADYIDDAEVVDALFAAVEGYAREKGCISVHGPLGFSDMDREGLLVEGFNRVSQFFVNYNYAYYPAHMERMGYEKDVDWIEFRVTLPERTKQDERVQKLERLVETIEKRAKLHAAPLKKRRDMLPYVEKVFELYNETYRILYGTVALTPPQVKKYVKEFLPMIDERSTLILLNEREDVVAFGVSGPSISLAQQKTRGRFFPIGWYHILKALKGKNDTRDLFLIAVHPDLQGKGIS
ncbi:MAG: N-acetyltransferase, partial [Clostridiales bacterium]|nr:N-acetyltransferase [Clostridiales bacterium]